MVMRQGRVFSKETVSMQEWRILFIDWPIRWCCTHTHAHKQTHTYTPKDSRQRRCEGRSVQTGCSRCHQAHTTQWGNNPVLSLKPLVTSFNVVGHTVCQVQCTGVVDWCWTRDELFALIGRNNLVTELVLAACRDNRGFFFMRVSDPFNHLYIGRSNKIRVMLILRFSS